MSTMEIILGIGGIVLSLVFVFGIAAIFANMSSVRDEPPPPPVEVVNSERPRSTGEEARAAQGRETRSRPLSRISESLQMLLCGNCVRSCRLELSAQNIRMRELVRIAEPLLTGPKELQIAVLPMSVLVRNLIVPLPEKAERQLIEILSSRETPSITIPLSNSGNDPEHGESIRVAVFRPDSTL